MTVWSKRRVNRVSTKCEEDTDSQPNVVTPRGHSTIRKAMV